MAIFHLNRILRQILSHAMLALSSNEAPAQLPKKRFSGLGRQKPRVPVRPVGGKFVVPRAGEAYDAQIQRRKSEYRFGVG